MCFWSYKRDARNKIFGETMRLSLKFCNFVQTNLYKVGRMSVDDASHTIRHSIVEPDPLCKPIQPADTLVMLGSCFAQYMGERMQCEGYQVLINPLGTLFNPFSIGQTIRAALDAECVSLPLFLADGEWRCWWANTRFKAPTPEELDVMLRQRFRELGQALRRARHLVLTFGTNVCYVLKAYESQTPLSDGMSAGSGLVVTNCQRQPDRLFQEWRASVDEIVQEMTSTLSMLYQVNPDVQVILTVSPYRYHKYGYHGSQLSKATLLLAEEALIKRFPSTCCYFPAYEILLDELRDYCYYAPDGHHPGPEAVEVIWNRFQNNCRN